MWYRDVYNINKNDIECGSVRMNEYICQQTSSTASKLGLNCSRMNFNIPTSPFAQLACRTVRPSCTIKVSIEPYHFTVQHDELI